jgi:hypothetical protein
MSETWIAKLLDVSYPEMLSLGSVCIWLAFGVLVLGICAWFRGNRRWTLGLGIGFTVLLVMAFVSIADPFCISGYIAHDGMCAWE